MTQPNQSELDIALMKLYIDTGRSKGNPRISPNEFINRSLALITSYASKREIDIREDEDLLLKKQAIDYLHSLPVVKKMHLKIHNAIITMIDKRLDALKKQKEEL